MSRKALLRNGTAFAVALSLLAPEERARFAAAALSFLNDRRVLAQESRFHYSGEPEDYAAYVRPLQRALKARGLELPEWDPATEVPRELLVAKASDSGRARRPPRKTKLKPFPSAGLPECAAWHDYVLEELAGAADSEESSAVPLVWCFHAFLAAPGRCRASGSR